ncbi:TPA: hypothetical protein ACQYFN_001305 [Vibrio parahaemolyticus]|nr:hypothetical protein [Vibrio parahaemolyticus]
MTSSWYRRGTVTVTDGSKEVVGVGTLWMDAGNKPLAGDIMLIAGGIYEVESITDNEHLSLFRAFNGVPPANGEYAIIRNTSVTIATRVAAMVASAINSKQVLIDDLRGYYTSTADKVLIHTDDGSTIEVVPLQTLVSDITKLIDQSESIKDDLVSTDAALSLIRKYSNAAQGVEVEPGMYSAKSYALDASDALALVNKAKNDVYAQAGEVHETKTDIEQFVSTSKTEIDAKATAISKAIDTQATTVKGEITALTSTSKQEITALATQSKKDITTLTTTSKSEINTLVSTSKTEITELATTEKAAISQQSTTAISEMTSLKQSAEQAASTATQKATQAAASATSAAQSKTDSQALKTQTEALANETKQVAEEIKSGSYVGWQIYCQSEANMKAARMLASEQFAASGFVHMGTQHSGGNTVGHINEGLWSATAEKNVLKIGRGTSSIGGSSKTNHAVTHIAGFISSLYSVNRSDPTYQPCEIKFPEAPNGTVVYDSTGNCRGSGKATLDLTKDVDSKYGDVAGSVNEAVARAFEGMTQNGDFRNGTRYWNTSAVSTAASGGVTVKGSNTNMGKDTNQYYNCIVGKQYTVEIVCSAYRAGALTLTNDSLKHRALDVNGVGTFKTTFTASSDPKYFLWLLGADMDITSVSVKPVSEEVVINRVDMFGFEYFLEEISKANPFVYPYGCIQSKLTSIEGIATKESNRPITYYSVFDGDTTSKGKGVDFWAATDAQKRALVSNPDHNIYLLDDGRLVQWRVRQRTIAAAKNGKWGNTNPAVAAGYSWLDCGGGSYYPQPQGSADYVEPTVQNWTHGEVYGGFLNQNIPAHLKHQGIFTAIGENGRLTANAVDGHCYFQVCGTVPRLNQGAYHPSFNPMGAAAWHKWGVAADLPWYDSRVVSGITSAGKCFTEVSATTQIAKTPGSGRISHGKNKRPDGKFYDAIYASGQGGVIDYRLPAWDMSSKEEASKIFQKVVNGTYRGEELAVRTWISPAIAQTPSPQATSIATEINTMDLYKVGGKVSLYDIATKQVLVTTTITGIRNGAIDVLDTFNRLAGDAHLVVTIESNIPVSGDFTQVDVIGEPANILTTPALANGWLGSWIPVIPDGTSKNHPLTRKAITSSVSVQISSNSGDSWVNADKTANTTTNTMDNRFTGATEVTLYTYTAFAKQTKRSVKKKVLNAYEGIGNVWATSGYGRDKDWGVLLQESLTGKVGVSDKTDDLAYQFTLSRVSIHSASHIVDDSVGRKPAHSPLTITAPSNNSNGVKALWYQTAANQQCSLNFAWNELVYKPFTNPIVDTGAQMLRKRGAIYLVDVAGSVLNGRLVIWNGNEASIPVDYTAYYVDANNVIKSKSSNAVSTIQLYTGDGWGDDSTVRIIDGIGTFINLNGDTCLYGTHELAIPYGYTKNKARAGSQVSGVDL